MNNLYALPPLRMIRLVRRTTQRDWKGFDWQAGVWALDTPASRRALAKLVTLGNATYGKGTHWIEEHDSETSCPLPRHRPQDLVHVPRSSGRS